MFTFSQDNRNRICTTAAKMLFATNYNMPQYKIITYNPCAERQVYDTYATNGTFWLAVRPNSLLVALSCTGIYLIISPKFIPKLLSGYLGAT